MGSLLGLLSYHPKAAAGKAEQATELLPSTYVNNMRQFRDFLWIRDGILSVSLDESFEIYHIKGRNINSSGKA
jgi:hypothetical protein